METAALDISPIAARFPVTFWLRTLNELTASGLEDALAKDAVASTVDYMAVLRALTIVNPLQLQFTAGDLAAAGEEFDTPAVAGRAQGRGRAAVRAVPLVPGPADIRYLSLGNLLDYESPGEDCPLSRLCQLVGMLGVCLTRASRERERAPIRVVGGLLKANLVERYGDGDGILAASLPDYIGTLQLPDLFVTPTSSVGALHAEARDTILYHRSERGQRDVENGRLAAAAATHVRRRCAPPARTPCGEP